jgi:hypothetical protein
MGAAKASDLLPLLDPGNPRFVHGKALPIALDLAMATEAKERDVLEACIRKLESSENLDLARSASIALVRMGRKDRAAQRALVERHLATFTNDWMQQATFLCESLLAVNEPKLNEIIEVKQPIESLKDLNAVFEPCGLRVEFDWQTGFTVPAGTRLTRFDLFRKLPYQKLPPGPPIMDKRVIRFMHHEQALEYWKDWLSR